MFPTPASAPAPDPALDPAPTLASAPPPALVPGPTLARSYSYSAPILLLMLTSDTPGRCS